MDRTTEAFAAKVEQGKASPTLRALAMYRQSRGAPALPPGSLIDAIGSLLDRTGAWLHMVGPSQTNMRPLAVRVACVALHAGKWAAGVAMTPSEVAFAISDPTGRVVVWVRPQNHKPKTVDQLDIARIALGRTTSAGAPHLLRRGGAAAIKDAENLHRDYWI